MGAIEGDRICVDQPGFRPCQTADDWGRSLLVLLVGSAYDRAKTIDDLGRRVESGPVRGEKKSSGLCPIRSDQIGMQTKNLSTKRRPDRGLIGALVNAELSPSVTDLHGPELARLRTESRFGATQLS